MSLYELLLSLHIIAAIIWLGAGFVITMLVLRSQLANDLELKAEVNAQSEWLAPRVFIPSAMLTFVFGLLLVIEGSFDLGTLWIVIGLAGWLASFGVGMLYFKPEGERIDALVQEHGAGHADVGRRLDRMEAVGRVELTVLFVVVFDMVLKPTGDDVGLLIGGAAVVALMAVLVFSRLGSQDPSAA